MPSTLSALSFFSQRWPRKHYWKKTRIVRWSIPILRRLFLSLWIHPEGREIDWCYYQYQGYRNQSYRAKNPTLLSYRSDRGKGLTRTEKVLSRSAIPAEKHLRTFPLLRRMPHYWNYAITGWDYSTTGRDWLTYRSRESKDWRWGFFHKVGKAIPFDSCFSKWQRERRGLVFSSRFIRSLSYSSLLADHYVYCLLCSLWKSRGQFFYLTWKAPEPPSDDPSYRKWEIENSTVVSWLIHSMEPEISRSYIFLDTAKEIWDAFSVTYSQLHWQYGSGLWVEAQDPWS